MQKNNSFFVWASWGRNGSFEVFFFGENRPLSSNLLFEVCWSYLSVFFPPPYCGLNFKYDECFWDDFHSQANIYQWIIRLSVKYVKLVRLSQNSKFRASKNNMFGLIWKKAQNALYAYHTWGWLGRQAASAAEQPLKPCSSIFSFTCSRRPYKKLGGEVSDDCSDHGKEAAWEITKQSCEASKEISGVCRARIGWQWGQGGQQRSGNAMLDSRFSNHAFVIC
jgi:hypothetical protein